MTPWKYSDDSYRDYTRTAWNESAQKYTKLLRNLEPYGFDLLARVDPKVRERCLDIATGPGEPAMSLARMVGLDGKVTGIDLGPHGRASRRGRESAPNPKCRISRHGRGEDGLPRRDVRLGRESVRFPDFHQSRNGREGNAASPRTQGTHWRRGVEHGGKGLRDPCRRRPDARVRGA